MVRRSATAAPVTLLESEIDKQEETEEDKPLKKRAMKREPLKKAKDKLSPSSKRSSMRVARRHSVESDDTSEPIVQSRKRGKYSSDSAMEDTDEDATSPIKNGKRRKLENSFEKNRISNKKTKNLILPSISEMVCDSVRALRDSPRKGSTLSAIKETVQMNYSLDMKKYDSKIKKYILGALATGELKQSRGKGLRGRVTLPKWKRSHKRRKTPFLTKKFDVDEVEYKPVKTLRDEERIKDLEDLELRRQERALLLEKEMAEKASRPKKTLAPKNEEWEVEGIQGKKIVQGKIYYLVKYVGTLKTRWEPEENVEGCKELISKYIKNEEIRKEEKERKMKEAEEKGIYEVARIIDVRFHKNNQREFLIRWKDWGADGDTWEKEDNLECEELISNFMHKVEMAKNASTKTLRLTPKKVDRLAFSLSKRSRRNGSYRVTYDNME